MTTPTQVRRPWRTTVRTVFQGLVAFCVLLPFLVQASGLDPQVYPWLAGILAVAAAVTRIMALPQVENFLAKFLPFLAADPNGNRGRDEGGWVVFPVAAGRKGRVSRVDLERRLPSPFRDDRGQIDPVAAALVALVVVVILVILVKFL